MTVSFPTTPEAFSDVQAQLAGAPVYANLQEVIAVWVPIFNDCFRAGRRNDRAELVASLDRLGQLKPTSTRLTHFLNAARSWMIYAWQMGRQAAREIAT